VGWLAETKASRSAQANPLHTPIPNPCCAPNPHPQSTNGPSPGARQPHVNAPLIRHKPDAAALPSVCGAHAAEDHNVLLTALRGAGLGGWRCSKMVYVLRVIHGVWWWWCMTKADRQLPSAKQHSLNPSTPAPTTPNASSLTPPDTDRRPPPSPPSTHLEPIDGVDVDRLGSRRPQGRVEQLPQQLHLRLVGADDGH